MMSVTRSETTKGLSKCSSLQYLALSSKLPHAAEKWVPQEKTKPKKKLMVHSMTTELEILVAQSNNVPLQVTKSRRYRKIILSLIKPKANTMR